MRIDRAPGERRQLALMLAPYLIGLGGLVLVPAVITLVLAFTDYDLIRPPQWIGLGNLAGLAEDPIFRTALTNSLVFAAVAVPARLVIALLLAVLLHRRTTFVGTARTVAAAPYAMPEIAYGLLWLWLFKDRKSTRLNSSH